MVIIAMAEALTYWMREDFFRVPCVIFTLFNTNITDVIHYEPV